MSGFSPDWLALREVADVRARNWGLLDALADHFDGSNTISVMDLGAGTGSTVRHVSGALPPIQTWTLVDNDPALIGEARVALSRWCEEAVFDPPPPCFMKEGRQHRILFSQADIARKLEQLFDNGSGQISLLTASALLDLASREWLDRLAMLLVDRKLPFYAALSYDGEQTWEGDASGSALDDAVISAFNVHQHRDKGFGPAMGPEAADYLAGRLDDLGFRIRMADSPWTLQRRGEDKNLAEIDRILIQQLADGTAGAVAELGIMSTDDIDAWRQSRRNADLCIIGHRDLLALPN